MNGQPRITQAPLEEWRFDVKNARQEKTSNLRNVVEIEEPQYEPTITERIADTIKRATLYVKVTPYIVKLIYGVVVQNWKTTVTAVIGAIAMVLNATGIIELSTEFQMAVVTVIMTVIGFLAADAPKNENP